MRLPFTLLVALALGVAAAACGEPGDRAAEQRVEQAPRRSEATSEPATPAPTTSGDPAAPVPASPTASAPASTAPTPSDIPVSAAAAAPTPPPSTVSPRPGVAPSPPHPDSQLVELGTVRLAVPADWPVHDLATDGRRCVRADRHAVYLGHASPSPDCPAEVVGHVETVQIEPLDQTSIPIVALASAPTEINGVPARLDPAVDTSHAIVAVLPDDGIVVTITFGDDRSAAERILASLERVPGTSPPPQVTTTDVPVSCAALGCPGNPGVVYTGLGFDACAAPTTAQMSAWLASPFRSVGIYIGGANRGCSQPNLTSSWVTTVLGQGWKLVPIYVGLQAPCASINAAKIDPATAAAQGAAAADDAMTRAAALFIGSQRPLFFDMEAYDNSNAACVSAVRTFVSAWAGRLHQGGYLAGFYSSAASGIADQSAIAGNPAYNQLDVIWFAHWNNDATVNEPNKTWLPDHLWANHQRMHQYRGGQQETYGGVTINVDRNAVDAQVVG